METRAPKKLSSGRAGGIYLALLILALILFYLPSFNNPPRSDYWCVFYAFHQVEDSTSPWAGLSLANYDPWQHGTFRPLAHLILYLEHKLFGVNFTGNHLVNFFMYCLSIVLLYRLAMAFSLDRFLAAAFLTVYAFLFSHFDIATWTFQIFSTFSFCALLLGFLCYLKFLRTGRKILLFPVIFLFWGGMFCSEVYLFWPLALLLLTYRFLLSSKPHPGSRRGVWLVLGVIYLGYLLVFLLTRTAGRTTGALPHPSAGQTALAAGSVFFNLVYNGIAVNIYPFLAEPVNLFYNIEMWGILKDWYDFLPRLIMITAGGVVLLLGLGFRFLSRHRQGRLTSILTFFLFLYFTNFFIVTFARLTTNEPRYVFSQFRYQYIPNALLALMIVAVLSILWRPKKRGKIIIGALLLPVLIINSFLSYRYLTTIDRQLAPLGKMLHNIRRVIKEGLINANQKLYIEEGVPQKLPSLCWNEDMAPFMKGNYQWIFPHDKMNVFSLNEDGAAWVIKSSNYEELWKNPRNSR